MMAVGVLMLMVVVSLWCLFCLVDMTRRCVLSSFTLSLLADKKSARTAYL